MKYLKKYNEDIDWDWVEEEEDDIIDIDLEHLRINKYPIKVYKENWETFVYDVFKQTKLDVRKLNRFGPEYGNDYIYIWLYGGGLFLGQKSVEFYLDNNQYPYDIDKVVEYK